MSVVAVREKILSEFKNKRQLSTTQLVKKFRISRQGILRHIQVLIRQGKILKQGTSRKTSFYVLNSPSVIQHLWKDQKVFRKRYFAKGLQEDAVYREAGDRPTLLAELSDNSRALLHYAFTEMLNNAIDHSGTTFIDVLVETNPQNVSFSITDHGVGIFENIRIKKELTTEMEALQDLLKGKQTTAPERHSGEGIFFITKKEVSNGGVEPKSVVQPISALIPSAG